MSKISIHIQSVLYHNDLEALDRAINHIANAIRVYDSGKEKIECELYYGDASQKPLFDKNDICVLEKKYPEIKSIHYIFFDENTGTAKGHNWLARKCDSDYIMIMNPDVLVCSTFFEEMLEPFQDKTVGLTEARQTPIEHPKEYNTVDFTTAWASTACVIFPTKIYKEIKGFDEKSFFMYCDDVDFSWRIRLAGYKLIYRPRAVVYHAKRLSSTGNWQPTNAERYYSVEAALMMAYKWSENKLLAKYLWDFTRSKDEIFNKAANEFKKKRKKGLLPEQLDKEHKIATFVNGEYTKHRFVM